MHGWQVRNCCRLPVLFRCKCAVLARYRRFPLPHTGNTENPQDTTRQFPVPRADISCSQEAENPLCQFGTQKVPETPHGVPGIPVVPVETQKIPVTPVLVAVGRGTGAVGAGKD